MSEEDGLEDREREALAIAGKIRRIVGTLPVVDKESGELRPAGYGGYRHPSADHGRLG